MVPPRAFVKRIGDIQAAGRHDPHVIRTIEIFALIIFDEHGHFFVGRDCPQRVLLVSAGNQVAFDIEIHAVGAAGGLEEGGKFAVHAPLEDAVVRLIGEEDVAVFVAGGAFGEFEASLIRERVRAGLAAAKARGVKIGRPKGNYNPDEIIRLRKQGLSMKKIAERIDMSPGLVHRVLHIQQRCAASAVG